MPSGWTNRGRMLALQWSFQRTSLPTNLYVAAVTSAIAPTADTNTLSQLTEIAAGNGYTTGGFQLTPNATDFPDLVEDDTSDYGEVRLKDVTWTASGGSIPASGGGMRYLVLTTDEGTVGNRQVIGWWDMVTDNSAPNGNQLGPWADLGLRIAA